MQKVELTWKPFPEHKPNHYSFVLVTLKSPTNTWVEIAGFCEDTFDLAGRGKTNFVTAWAEIPEPYKPEVQGAEGAKPV